MHNRINGAMNTHELVAHNRLIEELCDFAVDPRHAEYVPPAPLPGSRQEQNELDEILLLSKCRDIPALLTSTLPNRQRHALSCLLPPMQTGRDLARFLGQRFTIPLYRTIFNQQLVDLSLPPETWSTMQSCLNLSMRIALLFMQRYQQRCMQVGLTYERPRPFELDHTLVPLMDALTFGLLARCSVIAGVASEVAAMFLPQQREGWEHLADNIGMARLWAGVHYRSEHIHGLRLGRIIAGRLPLPIPITSLAAQAVTVELGIRELGIRELGIRMPIAA